MSEVTEFKKRPPISSLPPGETAQRNSRGHISKNGCVFSESQISNTNPSTSEIINFLTYLFDSGLGYSAINTVRSALLAYFDFVSHKKITSNFFVKIFIQGIYHTRPKLTK